MLKTVTGTMITAAVIIGVLLFAVNGGMEKWLPNVGAQKLTGDMRRALIVIDWDEAGPNAPAAILTVHTVKINQHQYRGDTDGIDTPPIQENELVNIGDRIEVRAHSIQSTMAVVYRIAVTIQTPEGDYPLTMLCTEPTRNSKVCVGVVPR